jgi:hypothetical protein
MANISLRKLVEANVDPKLVARSKKTGKLVYFKSPEAKAAAVKGGSHEEPKKDKATQSKQAQSSADMFKGDYGKERGGDTSFNQKSQNREFSKKKPFDPSEVENDVKSMLEPEGYKVEKKWSAQNYIIKITNDKTGEDYLLSPNHKTGGAVIYDRNAPGDGGKGFMTVTDDESSVSNLLSTIGEIPSLKSGDETPKSTGKSNYDDKSYWKLSKDDYRDPEFPSEYDTNDDVRFTADSLDLVDKAISDEFGKDFNTARTSSGGDGGWEGPMQVFANGVDPDGTSISISVGSSDNDGKFSIGFLQMTEDGDEELLFEPNWDALTGEKTLTPQQAYKVTKALLKMPEVQKLLKGEIKPEEFEDTYSKLKSKFSKNESTRLGSMIPKK